jgi:hypothetical protein
MPAEANGTLALRPSAAHRAQRQRGDGQGALSISDFATLRRESRRAAGVIATSRGRAQLHPEELAQLRNPESDQCEANDQEN